MIKSLIQKLGLTNVINNINISIVKVLQNCIATILEEFIDFCSYSLSRLKNNYFQMESTYSEMQKLQLGSGIVKNSDVDQAEASSH